MTSHFPLAPGEHEIRVWSARALGKSPGTSPSGQLFLTNRRLAFVERGGLLGRPRPLEGGRSVPLETIGGAGPHQSELRIGYGDRMVIEGIEIAGLVYELGREVRSQVVLVEIAIARQVRRRELGLADDLQPCRACGRWVPLGTKLCASCARTTVRPA